MYNLTLTEQDVETICFVGDRYGWSQSMLDYGIEEGDNTISEPDAWTIQNAIESDMDGGHQPFPMLDGNSELWVKLCNFWNSIV